MANINKRAFYVNGEMLRKVIELKGLTQADVYKTIGIGENTIYRVIKYNRMENSDDFDRMCRYLDIDPDLLLLETFVFKSDEFKQCVIVSTKNLNLFIDHLGYTNDHDKKLDKNYITDFFKGTPSSEYLDDELKKYLFDKILECRDCFSSMFFIYHIDHEINQSKSDDGFYKAFDSWFEKNIIKTSNKKLK